jgi:hypothetical protein
MFKMTDKSCGDPNAGRDALETVRDGRLIAILDPKSADGTGVATSSHSSKIMTDNMFIVRSVLPESG